MKRVGIYSRKLGYLANFMVLVIIAIIFFCTFSVKKEWKNIDVSYSFDPYTGNLIVAGLPSEMQSARLSFRISAIIDGTDNNEKVVRVKDRVISKKENWINLYSELRIDSDYKIKKVSVVTEDVDYSIFSRTHFVIIVVILLADVCYLLWYLFAIVLKNK